MSLATSVSIFIVAYVIGIATGRWHTIRRLRRHQAGMAAWTCGRMSSGPD